MTRQPTVKPAAAYDYRRYIELVQVLAREGDIHLWALCDAWKVEPVLRNVYNPNTGLSGEPDMHYLATIRKLAQLVIEKKSPVQEE
jgi:hypothetical protein